MLFCRSRILCGPILYSLLSHKTRGVSEQNYGDILIGTSDTIWYADDGTKKVSAFLEGKKPAGYATNVLIDSDISIRTRGSDGAQSERWDSVVLSLWLTAGICQHPGRSHQVQREGGMAVSELTNNNICSGSCSRTTELLPQTVPTSVAVFLYWRA